MPGPASVQCAWCVVGVDERMTWTSGSIGRRTGVDTATWQQQQQQLRHHSTGHPRHMLTGHSPASVLKHFTNCCRSSGTLSVFEVITVMHCINYIHNYLLTYLFYCDFDTLLAFDLLCCCLNRQHFGSCPPVCPFVCLSFTGYNLENEKGMEKTILYERAL